MTNDPYLSPSSSWPLPCPAIVIPINSARGPHIAGRAIGVVLQATNTEVTLWFYSLAEVLRGDLMMGIEGPGHKLFWAGVSVAAMIPPDTHGMLVQCRLGGCGDALLAPRNLTAQYDLREQRYVLGFPSEVLNAWQQLGVLGYRPQGAVSTCPECASIPVFRTGCPGCASTLLAPAWLIHHYRCGYTGLAPDWRGRRIVECPGCKSHRLSTGAEFLCREGHRCSACGWAGMELETFGHCRRCWSDFPSYRAIQREVPGYVAQRLDLASGILGLSAVVEPSAAGGLLGK